MSKPVCFIISPIGESGSEIRRNADDLRDLIIKPVMELYGFDVVRGDHRSEAGQIDIDVIRAVQESELCVIDISLPNPNVYYEFGRRDETGRPLILLKSKQSGDLPVDIATRRYIEYDLDSRRGLIDAQAQLKNFVEPVVQKGFESSGSGASLSEIAETLRRVERKLDRVTQAGASPAVGSAAAPELPPDTDPVDLFKLARRQRNIPMAEQAMDALYYRIDKHRWLDQIVEVTAAMGSRKAGDILIENADEFMDSEPDLNKRKEYLSYLTTNLNRTDRELENRELVERLAASLLNENAGRDSDFDIEVYNQLNRLYYGIYGVTQKKEFLQKSIDSLKRALRVNNQHSYLHYNLAMCMQQRGEEGDLESALEHALRCIDLDGDTPDDNHLNLACELMLVLNDPRLGDYLDRLEAVNPVKSQLIRSKKRG